MVPTRPDSYHISYSLKSEDGEVLFVVILAKELNYVREGYGFDLSVYPY